MVTEHGIKVKQKMLYKDKDGNWKLVLLGVFGDEWFKRWITEVKRIEFGRSEELFNGVEIWCNRESVMGEYGWEPRYQFVATSDFDHGFYINAIWDDYNDMAWDMRQENRFQKTVREGSIYRGLSFGQFEDFTERLE